MAGLQSSKVFGIGFHKTGTTSLSKALQQLGYQVTGPNCVRDADIARTYREKAKRLSKQFDAFQDNPWPLVYQEMDALWPNAKFILTVRDPQKWIASQVRHFGNQTTPMRKLIYGDAYGAPAGNEDHYIRVYNQHNEAVRAYFHDRPQDFLEIDLTENPNWQDICDFLGVGEPTVPFPHANKGDVREIKRQNKSRSFLKRVRNRLSSWR